MQHHKYSLFELESLIPWERDIYVEQLRQFIEKENLKSIQTTVETRTKRR